MRKLAIVALVGLLASPAMAAPDDIWNFEKVLNKGKENFRSLCSQAEGKVSKEDDTWLRCTTPNADSADVLARFNGGPAKMFTMVWAGGAIGISILQNLRESFGEEDTVTKEGNCRLYWWANPDGTPYTFVAGLCPEATKLLVAIPQ